MNKLYTNELTRRWWWIFYFLIRVFSEFIIRGLTRVRDFLQDENTDGRSLNTKKRSTNNIWNANFMFWFIFRFASVMICVLFYFVVYFIIFISMHFYRKYSFSFLLPNIRLIESIARTRGKCNWHLQTSWFLQRDLDLQMAPS